MKAITLHQPWASLIAIGAKRFETRSWFTAYRGEIAIHAGKAQLSPAMIGDLFREERAFPAAFIEAGFENLTPWDFPRSAVVAVSRLESCHRAQYLSADEVDPERAFGDFSPGRWCWCLTDVRRLINSIPCSGARGVWDVPADIEALIRKEIP